MNPPLPPLQIREGFDIETFSMLILQSILIFWRRGSHEVCGIDP